ncbi:MAG: lysylphosphatidylglycerol synthase transmembrane domain-containing protein [Burkholderiales bacterium]
MKRLLGHRGSRVAVRLGISLALLGTLLWHVDPARVIAPLQKLSPAFVLLACLYYAGCQLLSSWRWRMFLDAKGIGVPLASLFSYYMSGMFLNNFLPGAVGGDAARSYFLYRHCGQGHYALGSVFLERFAGLLGLGLISIGALAAYPPGTGQPLILGAVGGSAVLLMGIALALWWPPLANGIQRLLGRFLPWGTGNRLREFHDTLASYRQHPGTLVRAVLLSVAIQGLYALFYGLVALGLDISIDLRYFLLFLPPVTLLMLLPLSFGGLGIREAAFVVLFAQVGVGAPDVMAVSLTVHGLGILLSLAGGVLLVRSRKSTPGVSWRGT